MNQTDGHNISLAVAPIPTSSMIPTFVFMASLSVTIIANILTIVVIVKTPSLRTFTNAFLVSMSASDELYALFALGSITTVTVYSLHHFDYNPLQLAAVAPFAWGTLIHSTNGNLILVSLERWLYITHPFWYQRFVSSKAVAAGIAFIWVSALAVNIPYLFPVFAQHSDVYFLVLHGFLYPTVHSCCGLLLIGIYTHILLITSRQRKKISQMQPRVPHLGAAGDSTTDGPQSSRPSIHADSWKAVKLLLTVCGMFFVCVSPYVYFFSYILFKPPRGQELELLNSVLLIFQSLYHCSNFFVYVLRVRQFRQVLTGGVQKCVCYQP